MGYSIHRLFGLPRPGARLAGRQKEAALVTSRSIDAVPVYWMLRFFATGAVLAALAWPGAAQAALVNDYSQSDDVWNTPVAPGHVVIDTRSLYSTTTPNFLQAPTFSLVFGVTPGLEIGMWSAYTFTGIGQPGGTSGFAVLNPYAKYQFPAADGATAFGLVFGAQIPTQGGQEHDVAIEGVAAIPLSASWSVDLNAGIGRTFVTPATLGHLATAFYYSFPGKQTLLLEANVILSTAATPFFGQHVGLLVPLSGSASMDVGVAVNEASGIRAFVTPQLGLTLTL